MADIDMRLGHDVLVVQGFLEKGLHEQGFDGPLCTLNATEPETVSDLLQLYRVAGADCALTNTQGATSTQLASVGFEGLVAQINAEGVRMARAAGFPHVLARVSPCGIAVEPQSGLLSSPLAKTTPSDMPVGFASAIECYAEQAAALASAGPDAFMLTSFCSVDDCLAAITAIQKESDLPILVSLSPTELDETEIQTSAQLLERAGVSAIGCDSLTSEMTKNVLAWMRNACSLPLIALPAFADSALKAGSPAAARALDLVADTALKMVKAGATVVGSSEGSTPAITGAIFATVGGIQLP